MVGRFPCLFIDQTAKSDKKYWISTEYIKLVITSEGKIEKCPYKLTARKYSLFEIREKCLEKNEKYMRITSDEDYSKLSQEEVKGRLAFPNEVNTSEEPDKLFAQLKKVERTWHSSLWHDHARIEDTMIFMNGDNPSVEFEDGTQKGGHRGCVGCDGDMHSSFNLKSMSHRKYKTLKEKQNLVLTGPEGKKGGLYPFKNLKIEQLRGEL